jgi:hypothetical protein
MKLGFSLALAPVLAVAVYASSPFLTLYVMGRAIGHGDVRTLCADVSWNEVREGLKEDIADGITGAPEPAQLASNDDLPAFGASFVTGMAGNVVDRTVTPQHLADALATWRAAGAGAMPRIVFAHFVGPTAFEIAFRTPQERPADAPLRLRLRFDTGPGGPGWRVIRAWIPESLLNEADTHTS